MRFTVRPHLEHRSPKSCAFRIRRCRTRGRDFARKCVKFRAARQLSRVSVGGPHAQEARRAGGLRAHPPPAKWLIQNDKVRGGVVTTEVGGLTSKFPLNGNFYGKFRESSKCRARLGNREPCEGLCFRLHEAKRQREFHLRNTGKTISLGTCTADPSSSTSNR